MAERPRLGVERVASVYGGSESFSASQCHYRHGLCFVRSCVAWSEN